LLHRETQTVAEVERGAGALQKVIHGQCVSGDEIGNVDIVANARAVRVS
jgi:hypothetical protein